MPNQDRSKGEHGRRDENIGDRKGSMGGEKNRTDEGREHRDRTAGRDAVRNRAPQPDRTKDSTRLPE